MRQRVREREQDRRTRPTIVRPKEARLEEGVVVTRENENLLRRIRRDVELADDVVDRNRSARRGLRETVGVYLGGVFRELLLDLCLSFLVAG